MAAFLGGVRRDDRNQFGSFGSRVENHHTKTTIEPAADELVDAGNILQLRRPLRVPGSANLLHCAPSTGAVCLHPAGFGARETLDLVQPVVLQAAARRHPIFDIAGQAKMA